MEKHTPIVNDDLIAKFLAREATETESEAVNDWLLDSDENEKYFFEVQKVWEKAGKQATNKSKTFRKIDTDAAWQKLQGKEAKVVQMKPKRIVIPTFIRVAAAIVLLLGVGAGLYFVTNQEVVQVVFATTEKANSLLLADGSEVFVNRQSKITYPKIFSGKKRVVKLEGEAFFQVKSNKEKPFVVETQSVEIQVVGTAFNVKIASNKGKTEVIVQEGKVLVRSAKVSLYLTAGEQAAIEGDKITKQENIADNNFLAYKTKRLVFEGTPLSEAISTINALYMSEIVLANPALGKCLITVTFDNESVESITEIITNTLPLTSDKQGNQIILDGKGCE